MKLNEEIKINNLQHCYAKTRNGFLAETIIEHGILTGLIAKQIVKIFNIKHEDFISFVSSIHDVGKISVIFQTKIRNHELYEQKYKRLDDAWKYHQGISGSFLSFYYNNSTITESICRHHGISVNIKPYRCLKFEDEIYFDLRTQFVNTMFDYFKPNELIEFKDIDNEILSGIITISDWIASGLLYHLKDHIYDENINDIIYQNLSFLHKCELKQNLTFGDIFNGYTPTKTQTDFINAIIDKSEPGVYFVEEQAGNGKSEIALFVAYMLLNYKSDLRGIYFALPTQLTSNKMFERFQNFINIIANKKTNIKLLHSNSNVALYSIYNELMRNNSFIDNKNLELLNSFCVGTVDQILLSVLNSKFNFVKTFALYKKIIIIDEIHSYDEYTITLIKFLIENAKKLGCYVIALSATLPDKIKNIFYSEKKQFEHNYPLLTKITNNDFKEISVDANLDKCKKYHFVIESNDDIAIKNIIETAVNGNQTLWIENSVKKAQFIYSKIIQYITEHNLNIPVGLLHSKFLEEDKFNIENHWIDAYGKNSNKRHNCGRILISTQLVEQSIDIDCDVLYTRIAPMDMIIQRCGRCWRHNNKRNVTDAFVYILSNDSNAIINSQTKNWFVDPLTFEYSGLIYPKSILLKTLMYFEKHNYCVFPFDVREMINFAYSNECFNNKNLEFVIQTEKNNVQQLVLQAITNVSNHQKTKENAIVETRLIQDEEDVLIKNDYFELTDDYYINKINVQKNTVKISKKDLIKHGVNYTNAIGTIYEKYGINCVLNLHNESLYDDNNILLLRYNNTNGLFV